MAAALVGIGCAVVPFLVSLLPEPAADPDEDAAFNITEVKEPYRSIASLAWLRPVAMLAGALLGFGLGGRLDFTWELLALGMFAPVAVALFVIDLRTRYLPTWLIAPYYGLFVAIAIIAAIATESWGPILGSLAGWLVYGGFFLVIWLLVPAGGLGYGDVRLAGVLGLGLGLVSWGAFVLGMFAGVMLGGVTAVLLLVTGQRHKRYPYGPYLLAGALIGAMFGAAFADWYLG